MEATTAGPAANVFGGTKPPSKAPDLKTLYANIGQLTLENDCLEGAAHQGGLAEHKAMIDRTHPLRIGRPCQLLQLARSTAYCQPRPIFDAVLALMRRIDELL